MAPRAHTAPCDPAPPFLLDGQRPERVPEGRPHLSRTVAGAPRGRRLAAFGVIGIDGVCLSFVQRSERSEGHARHSRCRQVFGFPNSGTGGGIRPVLVSRRRLTPLYVKCSGAPDPPDWFQDPQWLLRPQVAPDPVDAVFPCACTPG